MSSIFPIREKISLDREPEPRLVDLDEETADEVFEALASSTTRQIFLELHRQPQTASDLAEVTDTSVQNIQYHLQKLGDVELVEVVDTWYSERGSEMKVYAPQDESLVLFAGRDKQGAFRRLVDRFAGVFALLAPPSVLAGWLANRRAEEGIQSQVVTEDEPMVAEDDEPAEEEVDETAPDDDVDEPVDTDDEPAADDGDEIGAQVAPEDDTEAPDDDVDDDPDAEEPDDDLDAAEEEFEYDPDDEAEVDGETIELELVGDGELATAENETVYVALESTSQEFMGIDPGVTAAFFLGGIVVYAALSLRRRF